MHKLLALVALALIPIAAGAEPPTFSDKPVWVSGSRRCGGDGNAQLIDFDQDGTMDIWEMDHTGKAVNTQPD